VGRSVPWAVLGVGRFKSWTFSDGTLLVWDVSRAGPFVCAPQRHLKIVTLENPGFNKCS
jgi:hypothetical protein